MQSRKTTQELGTTQKLLTEQTKNHQGGSKHDDQAYSDVRIYETMRIPNPVAAFEFYLQKRHRECPALFQTSKQEIM